MPICCARRSPANARRLLEAYDYALNGSHVTEHDLADPDSADALNPGEACTPSQGWEDHTSWFKIDAR